MVKPQHSLIQFDNVDLKMGKLNKHILTQDKVRTWNDICKLFCSASKKRRTPPTKPKYERESKRDRVRSRKRNAFQSSELPILFICCEA